MLCARRVPILLLAVTTAAAQQFTISTYAGSPSGTIAALAASIGRPQSVATDSAGNVYFTASNRVFKLDPNGGLTRIAGVSLRPAYSGAGGPAIFADLYLDDQESGWPNGLAIDSLGTVYIADRGTSRIRKISPDGIITTVIEGNVSTPVGLALDSAGTLYIADATSRRVFKLSPAGEFTTVAGNGSGPYSGDGGPALDAGLNYPTGLALDGSGNLYIADTDRVRKVSPAGVITTAAGNGSHTYSGDGGPATGAGISAVAVAVDGSGNLYIGDPGNSRVRKVTPDGVITTIAGNGTHGYSGDGAAATAAQLWSNSGVAVDGSGNLYIADIVNSRIRKVSGGIITTVAGNGANGNYGGDGGPAVDAQLSLYPWGGGMASDPGGNLYIADTDNQRVRKISPDGIISTVAGNGVTNYYSGDGGPATAADLNFPAGVARDSKGNLYIADYGNTRVRKVSPDGTITTAAQIAARALVIDADDNLYAGYPGGVHKISPDGTITTVTEIGTWTLAVDAAGNLYIGDIWNYQVHKISPAGVDTVVAGNGTAGFSGDGGPATDAQLNTPAALAVDITGNLFIADAFNGRIRMVSPDGTITTVAGNGTPGYSGDGGPATAAQFGLFSGLAVDRLGNVFAADQQYNAVRMLTRH